MAPAGSNKVPVIKLNSLVTLVLGLMLAITLAWASVRYKAEFDWTREGRHSLSEAGIRILSQLSGPVRITAYARDDSELRNAIRRYISKYQSAKPDISLTFVNPDSVPDRVRELGIRVNGELVFEHNGKTENVRAANENAVINALVRLSRAADTWLAFLTGHGERDLLGQANHDLGEFGKYLGNRGYNIRPLNLAEIQAIPDNTAILALAGPQLPLLPGETRMILDYLTRGGNFLWLLDPEDKPSQQWLSDFFNIDIAAGTVIDISGQLIGINDPTITTITASLYGQHPALENFEFTSLFPKSAALLAGDSDSWSSTPLLTTGELAWLESGSLEGEVEFNSETDTAGPLTIGLGLSRRPDNNTSEQRIAIIGDGDFLSNTYLGNSGNLDLGMRIVDWLSTDDALIDIPVRSASDTQLTVSPAILGGMGILFLIVLPVSLVGIGTFIWWRRRRA